MSPQTFFPPPAAVALDPERPPLPLRLKLGLAGTVTPVRALGAAGIIAATLSSIGGFANTPSLVGAAGAVMLVGNLYALLAGRR